MGPGDYIKVSYGSDSWKQITDNSAYGKHPTPRDWSIEAEGVIYTMWDIYRYAKKEDLE